MPHAADTAAQRFDALPGPIPSLLSAMAHIERSERGHFMAEESWHAARLIPTSGISGPDEQERRGTSAFLAVLMAVKEFGRSITTRLGAPAGNIEAFIEVPFDLDGRRVYPDGLIRVRRGQRTWTSLVEVKTGKNELQTAQLEDYLDTARANGFDALLTISNQIATAPGLHPTPVDKRKTRKVSLYHLAWSQIHTEAIMHKVNSSVSDPDQAWVLSELIRYLEHPKSGAIDFDDMGAGWVPVRDAINAGTLRATDPLVAEVASKWEQLIRYAGMRLGRELGIEVQPALTRREIAEPAFRLQGQMAELVKSGTLTGGLRVPNTVAPVTITADLRAGRVSCSVSIDAPREGRPLTRVNWLLRQLREASGDVRVDAFTPWARGVSRSELLKMLIDNPSALLDEQRREIRHFVVAQTRAAGTKRGQGRGSFVGSVLDLLDEFYATVMQQVKAWSPPPPKLRQPTPADVADPSVASDLVSTAMSSQDELEPDESV